MEKTPNYIKKTLDEVKVELLKDKKLQLSRKLYVQKLKEIFSKQVIDLKDGVQTKLSSTGTDKAIAVTSVENASPNKTTQKQNNKNQKVIFLNNEIIDQNLTDVDEANNELFSFNENVIELKDEIQSNDQKIIELIEEVDEIINLTEEVAETVASSSETFNDEILNSEETISDDNNQISGGGSQINDTSNIEEEFKNIDTYETDPDTEFSNLNEKIVTNKTDTAFANETTDLDNSEKVSLSNQQIDLLSAKINDLDLNSSELTEKLDELLNQKNLFSEKFNDELDLKLTEALNRSEENLEGKINNINDTYHHEFSKYEDETSKNFANLEDQIGQLNLQLDKIADLQDYNLKIENSLKLIPVKTPSGQMNSVVFFGSGSLYLISFFIFFSISSKDESYCKSKFGEITLM